VAQIKLSEEERQRIIEELGVEGGSPDWIPDTIEIHRASPDDCHVSALTHYAAIQFGPNAPVAFATERIPPWVLVAV
jgi:hypothetical protein